MLPICSKRNRKPKEKAKVLVHSCQRNILKSDFRKRLSYCPGIRFRRKIYNSLIYRIKTKILFEIQKCLISLCYFCHSYKLIFENQVANPQLLKAGKMKFREINSRLWFKIHKGHVNFAAAMFRISERAEDVCWCLDGFILVISRCKLAASKEIIIPPL